MPMEPIGQHIAELFPGLPPRATESDNKIRCTRRYQAWHESLQRAWAYAHGRARSEAERAALDAELERALQEGPDFLKYHRTAGFGDAPKISIDRNFAAKLMMLARVIERNSYAARDKGKHGGQLGRMAVRVLETMLFVVRTYNGRLCPSYDTLAMLAQMSRRTVITAISALERLGFITVHRRLRRVRTALGFTTVQDTNAYEIHPPRGFLGTLAVSLFGGKAGCSKFPPIETHVLYSKEKGGLQGMTQPPWGIPDGVFASTG